MEKIKVKAADGLRVPMAHNPYEYIGDKPMEVDNALYYRRLIAEGDLIEVSDGLAAEAGTAKKKGAENG